MAGPKGFLEHVDEFARFIDRDLRRTHGGWLQTKGKLEGYPLDAILWAAILAGAILAGTPTHARLAYFAVSSLLAAVVFYAALRLPLGVRMDAVLQAILVAGLGGVVWAFGSNEFQETGLYRHGFILLVWMAAAGILLAVLLAQFFFSGWRTGSTYPESLKSTELFQSRGKVGGVWIGALTNVIRPFHLLLLPAAVALVLPPVWLEMGARGALALSVALLGIAGASWRFDWIYRLILRHFSQNAALLVSIVVIALGLARYNGSTYVTTIFDSAQWFQIVLVLFSAYVLSWWFDYWVHRLIGQELLQLLGNPKGSIPMIPYPIRKECKATSVSADHRVLQLHGQSRFIALGEAVDSKEVRFESWSYPDLFVQLAAAGTPGGKGHPSPRQIAQRIVQFQAATAAIATLLAILFGLYVHRGPQDPAITVDEARRAQVSLSDLFREQTRNGRPVVLVAASGGGTRAAVYTAAVLEGLRETGHVQDVVLGSGVSGGGAALAYFASQRQTLIGNDDAAWRAYFDVMTKPFIQDVIDRASEWRVVSSQRLGILLSDSFVRRWNLSPDRARLGQVKDMGLILNSALAGHLDRAWTNAPPSDRFLDVERNYRKLTKSVLAGGRLIYTNLALEQGFAGDVLPFDQTTVRLPVIVNDREVRLESAAALNANFPPVFSNSAIDAKGTSDRRFWVTDGGAADNRGLEMLLYACRDALSDLARKNEPLPRLLVVVAEASGLDPSYSQNRGLGTLAGAGGQFATLVDSEIYNSIKALYKAKNVPDAQVSFHYLPMPDMLRTSGTFGTHWMLQDRISVTRSNGEEQTISGAAAVAILRAIHGAKAVPDAEPQVLTEVQNEPRHRDEWATLRKALASRPPVQAGADH